jgi:cold shock protein
VIRNLVWSMSQSQDFFSAFVSHPQSDAELSPSTTALNAAQNMRPEPPLTSIPQAPLDLIEVQGAIKWFDMTKGFGFIVPDDGSADVLVHVTVLKRSGYETAREGARIVCEAQQGQRGYQAFRVISLDDSTSLIPSAFQPPRTHVQVVPTSSLEKGVVKWFNRLRGFGFVTCGENKPDIFVHMEVMRKFGILELHPGQEVFVRYGDGSKGMMAAEVRLVNDINLPQ